MDLLISNVLFAFHREMNVIFVRFSNKVVEFGAYFWCIEVEFLLNKKYDLVSLQHFYVKASSKQGMAGWWKWGNC